MLIAPSHSQVDMTISRISANDDANEVAKPNEGDAASRRRFIQRSSLLLAGGGLGGVQPLQVPLVHGSGNARIRLGLIGCGGRGVAAIDQAMFAADQDIELVAMGDVFDHSIHAAYRNLKGKYGDRIQPQRFVGLDAYQGVISSQADVIYLATPPGFRPLHFEAAVAANKHVFMEKPVAVDAPGVRRVLAAGELAAAKRLSVQVGLQRRHDPRYQDCIAQIHQGALGPISFARAYGNAAGMWTRPRKKDQTELEYQLSNWYYFTWLSGDHIAEQHIHNLDVINWALQSHPLEAQGQGGRAVRTGPHSGQIFDHHMVEFVYPGGVRLFSQCRQMPGCWSGSGEFLHGSEGTCDFVAGKIMDRQDRIIWQSEFAETDGHGWQQEQSDLIHCLRTGNVVNEIREAANSTLTAVMGRMATYTGRRVTWNDAMNHGTSLADIDPLRSLNDLAPVQPDAQGRYPVAQPGKT